MRTVSVLEVAVEAATDALPKIRKQIGDFGEEGIQGILGLGVVRFVLFTKVSPRCGWDVWFVVWHWSLVCLVIRCECSSFVSLFRFFSKLKRVVLV